MNGTSRSRPTAVAVPERSPAAPSTGRVKGSPGPPRFLNEVADSSASRRAAPRLSEHGETGGWIRHFRPCRITKQTPIRVSDAQRFRPLNWSEAAPGSALLRPVAKPRARGGARRRAVPHRGRRRPRARKRVFARICAACLRASSPAAWIRLAGGRQWFEDRSFGRTFATNFRERGRYPVTLIKTTARGLSRHALRVTCGTLLVVDVQDPAPVGPSVGIRSPARTSVGRAGGGRGYYRRRRSSHLDERAVPPQQALGPTARRTTAARGASTTPRQLLWPERRLGKGSICG